MAEIRILSKKDLLLLSSLVQQEMSRKNVNSLSVRDKTVQVTPEVMRMLSGLLEKKRLEMILNG